MFLFSIITVCKNSESSISKTINSVINQTFKDYEYIVIDGLSKDNTLKIVEQYRTNFNNNLIVISEKDNGIYDAMNKGIELAKSKWCIFLNSGDTFYNENVLYELSKNEYLIYDVVYGNTLYEYNNKHSINIPRKEDELTFRIKSEFCHQSSMIKTNLLKNNKYSLEYKIASDYDFFIKMFISDAKFKYIDKTISIFKLDGISSTNGVLLKHEFDLIKYKYNFISYSKHIFNNIEYIIKKILKSITPNILLKVKREYVMSKITKNW